jgi:hypothetical protein
MADGYDGAFCLRVQEQLLALAEPVVSWSNLTLGPLPDSMIALLTAATDSSRAADRFAENFNEPQAMWDMVRTEASTAAWLAQYTK